MQGANIYMAQLAPHVCSSPQGARTLRTLCGWPSRPRAWAVGVVAVAWAGAGAGAGPGAGAAAAAWSYFLTFVALSLNCMYRLIGAVKRGLPDPLVRTNA